MAASGRGRLRLLEIMTEKPKNNAVALVTGGGGDIGRAIALKLAESWAGVAIVDIDETHGAETVRLLTEGGCNALFIRANVSNAAETAAYVDQVERELGPIGAFANNAGIEGVVSPIQDYPEEMFDRLMQVNVKGVFLGMKYVIAKMMARGEGAIVNTASTSAIRGRAGLAGYVASKHAVLGLTRVAALDASGTGIRINAVLPGPIESRMVQALDRQASNGFARAGAATYGTPESVANVVAFLLSSAASHVNGAAWTVDAGGTVA
jgi:NAD(P)-dependent dehydrogenase (short-subunit alcohol dehydrogenase family)